MHTKLGWWLQRVQKTEFETRDHHKWRKLLTPEKHYAMSIVLFGVCEVISSEAAICCGIF